MHQRDASKDLALISWPRGKRIPIFGSKGGYFYDVLEGIDKFIYLIDHGIDPQHRVRESKNQILLGAEYTGFSADAV